MKLLKRLLSKDFRRMELRIVTLEAELKHSTESQIKISVDLGKETEHNKHLIHELSVKRSVILNLEEHKKQLESQIREQSEADLLFATLKIVNELVCKKQPDTEELEKLQQLRNHALSALNAQQAMSTNNSLISQTRGISGLGGLIGNLPGL